MSTEKQARERMVQQRQHDEHLQESMLSRAEAEISNSSEAEVTPEHARELMTQQRQDKAHLQEAMLNRAEAEVGISCNPTPPQEQA